MKKLVLAIAVLLVAALASSQTGPVVTSASFLEWDYDTTVTGVTGFRVYISRTTGVVPDGTPDATIPWPTKQWAITAGTGQWHAIVTAVAGTVESAPSNQVSFFVLDPPRNPRVRVP